MNIQSNDQYLIAGNYGTKAGQRLAGIQQASVSSQKVDQKTLNRHLEETAKFYKDNNFSQIEEKSSEKTKGKSSEETTKEKKFFLEGTTDIYGALPEPEKRDEPLYPTMEKKLFPALDAMEKTVEELGKHPTPEEVDRSNIRRLIRAFQPVAEAFEGSYDRKDFKKSMKKIQSLASSLGKYKDISVIETELKKIYPDGKIPEKIQKEIDAYRDKQAENFQETYKDFRKEDMDKALKILRNPEEPESSKPHKLEAKDRELLSKNMGELLDTVEEVGLQHKDPETFHEGRKSLRKLLNSMNATEDTFGFSEKDVKTMTDLVNVYGQAQDKYIAYEWLHKNGFNQEASTMMSLYEESQKKALEEASKFMKSGTLERVRQNVQS
ncbi:MAG: CHAD domain-containing protein [Candidatus Eremiobacterota bacterium]